MRSGKYLYFRKDGKLERLPDDPASVEFAREYARLRSGHEGTKAKRTIKALIARYTRDKLPAIPLHSTDIEWIRKDVADALLKAERERALREAADKLHSRFYPKNEPDDWTEFARLHAAVAIECRQLIEALISEDRTDG